MTSPRIMRTVSWATLIYAALCAGCWLFSDGPLTSCILAHERVSSRGYDNVAGIQPVTITLSGFIVPFPFVARAVWNSQRHAPRISVASGSAGWFLCAPFGARMINSKVLWAKD